MRRFIAVAVALTILSAPVSGCSQPIDTGSSVPAQSQPFVALLALIGLGIGLTAWHHHNLEHEGSGGGSGPILGAQFSLGPLISGYKAVDLVVDPVNVALGALEVPAGGGGTGKFTEIQAFSGTAQSFGTYTLPANYSPAAVAIDANGLAWFVDASGKIQGCAVMSPGTSGTCTSQGTFSDGLGAGSRSIAVDVNGFIVVIIDGGSGTVKWWATQGGAATGTGTYTSASTSPIYAADSIKLTTTPPAGFTVFHQDGSSDVISFAQNGSTLSITVQANFNYQPPSLVGLSDFGSEVSGKDAFYGFTGAPAGSYSMTKYETTSSVGVGSATATSQLIDHDGQVGNPGSAPFTAPLASPQLDTGENAIWAIDAGGRIVNFTPF
ncbi:MAG TPA: hypothetical protein VEV38_00585 [Candidatus Eremiobacteraceae bacterium]|nr:hypothetical protein [Candidatus Eremiobacteraceae bacterium]